MPKIIVYTCPVCGMSVQFTKDANIQSQPEEQICPNCKAHTTFEKLEK